MRKKLYVMAALVMAVVLLAGCGRTFTDIFNSMLGRATDEKLEELEDIKESAEAEAASIREELEKDSLTDEERESLEAALAEAEETSSKAAVKIEKHSEYESSKAESVAESKKEESSKAETTVAEGEEEPTSKAADETTAPASSVSEATTTTPAGTTSPATTKPAETTAPAPTTVAPTTVAPTTVAPTTVAPTTVAPTTAHSHSYSAAVVQNPTCTANGVRRYTCSCGSSYDEAIPATGHNWAASTSVIHHDAVLGTVHHDEVGHYEERPVMEEYPVCNHCGGDLSINYVDGEHQCPDGYWSGSWHTGYRQVGTTSVYVVDQEAYDETVIVTAEWDESVTTYKCSFCGATK